MPAIGPIYASPIVVIADACLNTRHRSAGCRRCVDVCPTDAVVVVDDRGLHLDPGACVGCGACTARCPTQALMAPRSDRSLQLALADVPAGAPVRLACPRGGVAPVSMPTIRHDRCLAALGGEALLGLAGDQARHLWLDDAPCGTCDLGELHAEIERAARDADEVRAAFGLSSIVHRTQLEPATEWLAPGAAGPVVSAVGGSVSRRGLLRRLFAVGPERRAGVDGGAPARRQLLLRRLRSWAAVSAAVPLPAAEVPGFGAVSVDADRCSACGLCSTFCPTGALGFHTATDGAGAGSFTLTLDASQCVDCGLCAVACPEHAVTVASRLDPAAVLSGSTTVLVSGRTTTCDACGSLTAARSGADDRCFGCRSGVVSSLRDEVGLMADLLGRLPKP